VPLAIAAVSQKASGDYRAASSPDQKGIPEKSGQFAGANPTATGDCKRSVTCSAGHRPPEPVENDGCGLKGFKGEFGSAANFELVTWIKSKRKSSDANRQSFWI
jgi:hypothetical protein